MNEIKLLDNGLIKCNTRLLNPVNKVMMLTDEIIVLSINDNKYFLKLDTAQYFRLSLWAHRLTFDHANVNGKGVVAYNNGFEHKSLASAITNAPKRKKVKYVNGDKLDCTLRNLEL